jgi:hypothetical protein
MFHPSLQLSSRYYWDKGKTAINETDKNSFPLEEAPRENTLLP